MCMHSYKRVRNDIHFQNEHCYQIEFWTLTPMICYYFFVFFFLFNQELHVPLECPNLAEGIHKFMHLIKNNLQMIIIILNYLYIQLFIYPFLMMCVKDLETPTTTVKKSVRFDDNDERSESSGRYKCELYGITTYYRMFIKILQC